MAEADLKRTPLHSAHLAAGAKLVPFAGWEMPIQYGGIREEHLAVRGGVGIFDVSHMGQIAIGGPQAAACLQRLVSSDIRRIPEGGAQYSLLCNEAGGVVDDLFIYRLAEQRFLIVTNAANHAGDFAWMQAHAQELDAEISDCQASFAMLAVQGPRARALVQELADGKLPPRLHCCERAIAGVPLLVCGTGYTGEDGVELLCDPDQAGPLWAALVDGGAEPVGLGARDTLRLEACFHLYGNDLDERHDPISAGLGWACAEQTGFIGADAISKVRLDPALPELKLVPFAIEGPGIARQGNPIVSGGVVTSGTYSPSMERGIGLAYVSAEHAVPGSRLQIDVRGTIREAVVETKPLYRKDQ
ncbi:MAG TPA: glycine cleavage system aminomethyltransferase GcvT [Solirubrobacteraceae bacterium]|jgi:aminomethyltransferase|nr:glycine cleavage system aminomethyltransferase GcvT [Solirubrobacteraceae bacterium]